MYLIDLKIYKHIDINIFYSFTNILINFNLFDKCKLHPCIFVMIRLKYMKYICEFG